MMVGQFSTSAPTVELTAAAAVGLFLEEENFSARLRRVCWLADSTYALEVAAQKCNVMASAAMANHVRGAWTRVQRMTRAEACHVRSHTGESGKN